MMPPPRAFSRDDTKNLLLRAKPAEPPPPDGRALVEAATRAAFARHAAGADVCVVEASTVFFQRAVGVRNGLCVGCG